MEEINELFSTIEDKRHPGYVKHNLVDVLIMIMGGVICGITELADMMVYFKSKLSFYKQHYGIEKYPSKPTLSRILNMVDGDAVGRIIIEIMRRKAGNLSDIIAADGKAIRSTGQKEQVHSFLQILTAYVTGSGVTLGQEAISHEDKTNEIPVFQSMLNYLNIKGKTITADAMHCQKDTCRIIKGKGGDYLFGLKGNQSGLLEDVALFFSDTVNEEDIRTFKTTEINGGRIEKRICRASDKIHWLSDLPLWEGLQTILSITRITTAKGKTTEETSYYISSLPCDPQNLLYVARAHWHIESMHWSLDVIWHEDSCGLLSENGHKTLNAFRKLALLAHKRYVASLTKKPSIKSNVLDALLNDDLCLRVLHCL
jgi:predicted transposase YbfD/YdcC